jgi:uncharacterized membrane protein
VKIVTKELDDLSDHTSSREEAQMKTSPLKASMKDSRERKMSLTQGKEPFRLVALSDGLFATVLTLLVLDLRIPDTLNVSGGNPTTFIKWIGPHLFSYLLTFLVAGTFWLAHHKNFDYVVHFDRGLLGYNLLFLLFIGLLPFSTAAISLGRFQSSTYTFYWAIYAANIILAGIMLNLTWNYAVSHRLVTSEITGQQCLHITIRQIVTPAVFLISIIIQYLFPYGFLGPYILLVIPLAQWGVDRSFVDAEPKRLSVISGWAELGWRLGSMLPWLLILGLAIWATTI